MHLILDKAQGNSSEAKQFYADTYPNRWPPSRHFEHQL
jgi:hypothetical protein